MWLSEDSCQLESAITLRSLLKSVSCLKGNINLHWSISRVLTCLIFLVKLATLTFILFVDSASVTADHNKESQWWKKLRIACATSSHISSALIAAIVGRSVAHEMARMAIVRTLSL